MHRSGMALSRASMLRRRARRRSSRPCAPASPPTRPSPRRGLWRARRRSGAAETARDVTLWVDALILVIDPFDAERQPDDDTIVQARQRQVLGDRPTAPMCAACRGRDQACARADAATTGIAAAGARTPDIFERGISGFRASPGLALPVAGRRRRFDTTKRVSRPFPLCIGRYDRRFRTAPRCRSSTRQQCVPPD
jgi:hypothetical protein